MNNITMRDEPTKCLSCKNLFEVNKDLLDQISVLQRRESIEDMLNSINQDLNRKIRRLEDRLGYNCTCDEYTACEKCDTEHDRDKEGKLI